MMKLAYDKVSEIEDLIHQATITESKLPDKHKSMMRVKSGWGDYVYDENDRKDQEPEQLRLRITGKQIDVYENALKWLSYLGQSKDLRTVKRKRIVWARGYQYSYAQIGRAFGMSPKTVENWYKKDIGIIVDRVRL